MPSPPTIYQLKITLSDVKPPIWRRVQVPADTTLYSLAAILITVMGWTGYHLHQFRIKGKQYGLPDEEGMDLLEVLDERHVSLREIVEAGTKSFVFEYDFGDGWAHQVWFEGEVEPEPDVEYPRCTGGARQCPPEDCGGPWGYADFLEAIRDPSTSAMRSCAIGSAGILTLRSLILWIIRSCLVRRRIWRRSGTFVDVI